MTRRTSVALYVFASFILAAPTSLLAHQDDPKVLDREPRYEGPGWIAGDDNAIPRGDLPFTSSGIELQSWISLPDFDAATGSVNDNGNSIWGYVSPAGREYAIMGLYAGTAFVEITDPANPVVAGFIDGPHSLWRDMKTYQNYCYAISEGGGGIQVISMANIDAATNRVTLAGTVTADGSLPTLATHTLFVNEASGYLYRCGGGNNGLRIYSLANPAAPAYVGQWTDRYVHECQVLSYTSGPYAGKEIAFVCSGGFTATGLDILDVTNKQSIINLTPNRIFWSNAGYSHQLWLTPDRQYAFLNDELDEQNFNLPSRTIIINTQSLENASVVGEFTNNNTAIGHNLYTKGNLILESNYRSGLRIFCADNPLAPVEIAWFDTYPGSDSPNFNGLWNNYSYFPSGTIIGSDIERGLFVWKFTGLSFSYPQGRPALVAPSGGTVLNVSISVPPPSPCLNGTIDTTSARLNVNTGNGYVAIPLTDLGNGQYQAAFPSAPCGQQVSYYVSVQNTSNETFTDPAGAPSIQTYTAVSATGVNVTMNDTFEVASGWTVGDPSSPDTATLGIWNRGDPEPTAAQPGDDHTDFPGTQCWVTDWHAGTSLGSFDVDGGKTTLMSPTLNATALADPHISYWRWYSNNAGSVPNADTFVVSISGNNGSTWTPVETVGPSGPEAGGGWYSHSFRIADIIPPSSTMKIRFVASDLGGGSIVEAAVDDFQMFAYTCNTLCTKADVNNDGLVDGRDVAGFSDVVITGGTPGSIANCAADVNNDGTPTLSGDLAAFVNCVLGGGCP